MFLHLLLTILFHYNGIDFVSLYLTDQSIGLWNTGRLSVG
jgi:hypothetical protein